MKKTADPFYGREGWKRARQMALDRDVGLCVRCRDAGRYARDRHGRRVPVLATMVHHKKPLREYPELALSLDNLESLCDRCHDEEHPEKHQGMKRPERDPIPDIAKRIRVERL